MNVFEKEKVAKGASVFIPVVSEGDIIVYCVKIFTCLILSVKNVLPDRKKQRE